MKNIFKLIKIANKLDDLGLHKEADSLDALISKLSSNADQEPSLEPLQEKNMQLQMSAIDKIHEFIRLINNLKFHPTDDLLLELIHEFYEKINNIIDYIPYLKTLTFKNIYLKPYQDRMAWNSPFQIGPEAQYKKLPPIEASLLKMSSPKDQDDEENHDQPDNDYDDFVGEFLTSEQFDDEFPDDLLQDDPSNDEIEINPNVYFQQHLLKFEEDLFELIEEIQDIYRPKNKKDLKIQNLFFENLIITLDKMIKEIKDSIHLPPALAKSQ